MSLQIDDMLAADIRRMVDRVLEEDIGAGDLTAALVPTEACVRACVLSREAMILAGRPWFDMLFSTLDGDILIDWSYSDGDRVPADATLCTVSGPARPILSGERGALNLLQTLSATATTTAKYVDAIAGTNCRVLDTRKTLPGLRLAQKYAVRCGGGTNHRVGLFDAILIKENHILAAGSIDAAVRRARETSPGIPVEVEVESLNELEIAIASGAERVLLDNFSLHDMRTAVSMNRKSVSPKPELEASGNLTLETIRDVAETGVDFVSVGALTKHVRAIDLSMRFDQEERPPSM